MKDLLTLTNFSLTEDELAVLGLTMVGLVAVLLVIALAWYIVNVIAMWRMFKKMGEPGWKSIVPLYNSYVLFRSTWSTKIFWLILASSVLGSLFGALAREGVAVSVMDILSDIAGLYVFIVTLQANVCVAKSFGKGVGFGIGLTLLNPIFMLILGYGASTYQGNGYEI